MHRTIDRPNSRRSLDRRIGRCRCCSTRTHIIGGLCLPCLRSILHPLQAPALNHDH